MLTDIFANRYSAQTIWTAFDERDRALLVQCFRNIAEQVLPYWEDGKVVEAHKAQWESIERRLSMELGLVELAPRTYGFYNAQNFWMSGTWSTDKVCKDWFLADFKQDADADRFMKERISFVELAFRDRDRWLTAAQGMYEQMSKQGKISPHILTEQRRHERLRQAFNTYVVELNERFRQASCALNYHNGFIQRATDERLDKEVVSPFWKLVDEPKWANVSMDMAEAVDRRDTNGRDPAFYAAKALESVIKIISDDNGWTRGTEKGASGYIDNLVAQRSGARFVEVWERELLNTFFGKVRNPLGHGPGGEPMPGLTAAQTDWAIESAMSWCKSLIGRHAAHP